MEEQTTYSYPLNSNKNACPKDVDENVLNATMEGSNVQEPVKRINIRKEFSDIVAGKCSTCLNSLGILLLNALDFLIAVGSNESVRNVIIVFLTVCLEVFVVMVLAASTVLTTIIVNVDEAYRAYGKAKDQIEIGEDENVNCRKDAKEESEFDDGFRIDRRLSNEYVTENVNTKLMKII
ncbi:hypothetical protein FQR65_LT06883 [Abscondita terminalis]|nr:hypothetical protein FQR65_LT06883 [Abscondita terminalis]